MEEGQDGVLVLLKLEVLLDVPLVSRSLIEMKTGGAVKRPA